MNKYLSLTRFALRQLSRSFLLYWGVILVLAVGLALLFMPAGGRFQGGSLITLNCLFCLIVARHVNQWTDWGFQNGASRRTMWLATLTVWPMVSFFMVICQAGWNFILGLGASSRAPWHTTMMLASLGYRGHWGIDTAIAAILFEMGLMLIFAAIGVLAVMISRSFRPWLTVVVALAIVAVGYAGIALTAPFWNDNHNAVALFTSNLLNGSFTSPVTGAKAEPWLIVACLFVILVLLAWLLRHFFHRLQERHPLAS